MELGLETRRLRYAAFVLLAITISLIDGMITRSVADPEKHMLVAAAATIDLVLVVAAIYYWLLVRPGIRGRGSLVAIVLLGALRATLLFPNARAVTALVSGSCEAGLIAFVVVQVRRRARRGLSNGDPVDAIRTSLEAVFPAPGVARLVAAELNILYYAFFSWRAKSHLPADAQAFSLHKKGGQADLFYVVALASVMEIVPMHLLIRHWSEAAAWIATGVSLYGMVWLIGLARSIVLRPMLVTADCVDVRFGLIFRARVPREHIASVRIIQPGEAGQTTRVPRRSEPNVCIELTNPIEAEGPFGIRRLVTGLALAADDETGFRRALGKGF